MNTTNLPAQMAPHVPSVLIPDGVDPRTVVVIQQAPRNYTGPVVLVLVSSSCAAGIVLLLCLLLQVAATTATAVAAAAPAGLGLSMSLRRKGK